MTLLRIAATFAVAAAAGGAFWAALEGRPVAAGWAAIAALWAFISADLVDEMQRIGALVSNTVDELDKLIEEAEAESENDDDGK